MTTKPHVEIVISAGGSVNIDAKCFTGSGCAKATEQIELVLGGGAQKKKTKKPEFFGAAGGKQTTALKF